MSGPWTRHGYAVDGVTLEGPVDDHPPIARCGGPALCGQCSVDAERIRREAVDSLLDTRAGLPLANTAWNEGAAAMVRAVEDAERTGVFTKPRSPYSAPLLRMMKEAPDERR